MNKVLITICFVLSSNLIGANNLPDKNLQFTDYENETAYTNIEPPPPDENQIKFSHFNGNLQHADNNYKEPSIKKPRCVFKHKRFLPNLEFGRGDLIGDIFHPPTMNHLYRYHYHNNLNNLKFPLRRLQNNRVGVGKLLVEFVKSLACGRDFFKTRNPKGKNLLNMLVGRGMCIRNFLGDNEFARSPAPPAVDPRTSKNNFANDFNPITGNREFTDPMYNNRDLDFENRYGSKNTNWQLPEISQPDYLNVIDDNPMDNNPMYDNPMHDNPIYDDPIEDNPIYDNPMHDNYMHGHPIYDNPIRDNPVYDNPMHYNYMNGNPTYGDPHGNMVGSGRDSDFQDERNFEPRENDKSKQNEILHLRIMLQHIGDPKNHKYDVKDFTGSPGDRNDLDQKPGNVGYGKPNPQKRPIYEDEKEQSRSKKPLPATDHDIPDKSLKNPKNRNSHKDRHKSHDEGELTGVPQQTTDYDVPDYSVESSESHNPDRNWPVNQDKKEKAGPGEASHTPELDDSDYSEENSKKFHGKAKNFDVSGKNNVESVKNKTEPQNYSEENAEDVGKGRTGSKKKKNKRIKVISRGKSKNLDTDKKNIGSVKDAAEPELQDSNLAPNEGLEDEGISKPKLHSLKSNSPTNPAKKDETGSDEDLQTLDSDTPDKSEESSEDVGKVKKGSKRKKIIRKKVVSHRKSKNLNNTNNETDESAETTIDPPVQDVGTEDYTEEPSSEEPETPENVAAKRKKTRVVKKTYKIIKKGTGKHITSDLLGTNNINSTNKVIATVNAPVDAATIAADSVGSMTKISKDQITQSGKGGTKISQHQITGSMAKNSSGQKASSEQGFFSQSSMTKSSKISSGQMPGSDYGSLSKSSIAKSSKDQMAGLDHGSLSKSLMTKSTSGHVTSSDHDLLGKSSITKSSTVGSLSKSAMGKSSSGQIAGSDQGFFSKSSITKNSSGQMTGSAEGILSKSSMAKSSRGQMAGLDHGSLSKSLMTKSTSGHVTSSDHGLLSKSSITKSSSVSSAQDTSMNLLKAKSKYQPDS